MASAFFLSACDKKPAPRSAHNIVLIVIDSLRADHVGCYGYEQPTTPALDVFAAGAIRFSKSYSTSPWTLPSHASMFTGLYEDAHRATKPSLQLDDRNQTLAELLSEAGFDTAAIICAPFLRREFNIQQGFKHYDERIATGPRKRVRQVKTSNKVTKRALSYLKKRERIDQPFFLFVHYWDPHYDYNPPPEYVDMFDPDYAGTVNGDDYSRNRDIATGMDPRDLQHIIALYDGEIRYTDDHLAKLLSFIDGSSLAENTAIIITSDHGEEFLEHGSTGHTFTCYEELIRVPLVMRVPWLKMPPAVIDTTVENVDLFPTMLTLAGLRPTTFPIHGYDLLPLITNGYQPPRERFYCETQMGRRFGWRGERGIWSSLRDAQGNKVHHFRHGADDYHELYDLTQDEGEHNNLFQDRLALRKKMAEELARLQSANNQMADERNIRRLIRPGVEKNKKKKKGKKKVADDLEQQLKGLGYMQ